MTITNSLIHNHYLIRVMSLSLIRRTACDVTYTMIMGEGERRERERKGGRGEKEGEREKGESKLYICHTVLYRQ